MGHFNYPRHFIVLALVVGTLAATSRWRPSLGTMTTFGLYGALHSSALVVSLRTRSTRLGILLFIVGAAALSVSTASMGLYGTRFMGSLPAVTGPMLLLAMSSGLGAGCYALLIRRFWVADLSFAAIGAVIVVCVTAVLFVLLSGIFPRTGDGLWLAASWWFAFSAGLGFCDIRTRNNGIAGRSYARRDTGGFEP